jgi:hypothetical protein
MAIGYGDTSYGPYRPYGEDELSALESMLGRGQGAPGQLQAGAGQVQQQAPIEPMMAPEPALEEAPSMAPPPETPATPPYTLPPQPEPLDLTFPAQQVSPGRGMVESGYSVTGVPAGEREKLMSLYQQMADNRMQTADQAVRTEAGILQRGQGRAQSKLDAARGDVASREAALQAELRAREKLQAEGREWSLRKDDPAKAFEGAEWAGVLGLIGVAAGTFAEMMGWSRGNPNMAAFDDLIDRTVSGQREQKSSRLNEIRARIGDSQAAESLLRAQLNDAVAQRAEAEAEVATTQDAFDRLSTIAAEARQKAQELTLGAYERLVGQETRQFERPRPTGGTKTPIDMLSDLLKLRREMDERGYQGDDPRGRQVDEAIAAVHGQIFGQAKPTDDSLPAAPSDPLFARAKDIAQDTRAERADVRAQESHEGPQFQSQTTAESAYNALNHLATAMNLKRDKSGSGWTGDTFNPSQGTELLPGAQRFLLMGTPAEDAMHQAVFEIMRAKGISRKQAEEELGVNELLQPRPTYTPAQAAERINNVLRSLEPELARGRRKQASIESRLPGTKTGRNFGAR